MYLNIYRKGLGKKSAQLLSTLSAERKEVFSVEDAAHAIGVKGSRLRKMLHDLSRNRWIERIERGKYLIIPLEAGIKSQHTTHPFIVARSLVTPYYIGFISALNYYGITEQVSKTIFVASTKKKKKIQFGNDIYYFVTLSKTRFFGIEEEWIGNSKCNLSNKEKTIIDCLFIPEYSGGLTEVVKVFKEELDYEKLYEYTLKMEDLALVKRLGYLLDVLGITTSIIGKLLRKAKGGYCLLDTGGPKSGAKNKKWRIIENITKKDLLVEL